MKRFLLRLSIQPVMLAAAMAAMAAGCSTPTAIEKPGEKPEPEHTYWVAGYHPYWLGDAWTSYDLSIVKKVMFFDVTVGATGKITNRNGWPANWMPLIEKVRAADGMVVPTVSMFDRDDYVQLFSDPASIDTLTQELLTLIDEQGLDGLHLDFEIFDEAPRELRPVFTDFVAHLRNRMDEHERTLYLTLFSLAFDTSDNFEEGRLARHVDYLVVQGYDLHWLNDEQAGPVAPLEGWGDKNWQTIVERHLDEGVPREKIVMSVPYYGYEWPTTSDLPGSPTRGAGRITTYAPVPGNGTEPAPSSAREQAERFELQRDLASGSPYYVYEDSTGWVQGWFEDAQSLSAKYEFIKDEQLGGIAIFPLGYGDESLHDAIRDAFESTPLAAAPSP